MSIRLKIALLRGELLKLLNEVDPNDEKIREQVRIEIRGLVKDAERYLYPPPPNLPTGMRSVRNIFGAPLFCSACFEPQFQTRSGVVCVNGHGGAAGVPSEEIPATKRSLG